MKYERPDHDEIRVMPGMILGYQQEGAHSETLLYVASVRRAKAHTTATLKRGFSGHRKLRGVWTIAHHRVKFPDHLVRDPFRIITSADLRPRQSETEAWEVPACLAKPHRPCCHNGLGACRRCAEVDVLKKPTIAVVAAPEVESKK